MKVFRITLGFEPVSVVDVAKNNIVEAINDVILWLKNIGNDIDESIVISAELISEINNLESEEVKDE